jgi:hypothetical protein
MILTRHSGARRAEPGIKRLLIEIPASMPRIAPE